MIGIRLCLAGIAGYLNTLVVRQAVDKQPSDSGLNGGEAGRKREMEKSVEDGLETAAGVRTAEAADNWCVYLIRCADGSLYCGISNRPAVRWAAHCAGRAARYTRSRGVVEMRLLSAGLSRSAAGREEWRIKQLNRRQKQLLWAAVAEPESIWKKEA